MRNARWMAVAVMGVLAAGCGSKDGSEAGDALDNVPEAEALTLELTGTAADAGQIEVTSQAAAVAWPTTQDDLVAARDQVRAVNTAIRKVFELVGGTALVAGPPGPGRSRWYGPYEACAVDTSPCPEGASAVFSLWVGASLVPAHGYEFVLVAKAPGAADAAYDAVLAGWMRRGAVRHRGVGRIWMNLENLRAAAPTFPGAGHLYAGFGAGRVAKSETLILSGFTPDAAGWAPATVALRGYRTEAGTRRVRVATVEDYLAGDEGDELGLAHLAYDPDLGGRAYGVVVDGDVAAGSYYLGRSCYAAGAPEAPVYKEWFFCDAGQGPAACISAAGGAGTPADGFSGTWAGCPSTIPETPAFAPPAAEPADPTAIPAALPGEDGAGITPEEAPTSGAGAPTQPAL